MKLKLILLLPVFLLMEYWLLSCLNALLNTPSDVALAAACVMTSGLLWGHYKLALLIRKTFFK